MVNNLLAQLETMTVIVADTGDIESIREHRPREIVEVPYDRVHAQARVRGCHPPKRNAERQFRRKHVGAEHDLGRLQSGQFLQVARQVSSLREDAE